MKNFWDDRLAQAPSLVGTGHRAFNLEYNKALYSMQSDTLDLMLKMADVSVSGKSVLDIGSGIGYYIEYFSRLGASSITGIDIAPSSITYLQDTFPQFDFYCTDVGTASELPVSGVDIISSISVLYHIVNDNEFENALHLMCDALAPDGYLLITDMFRPSIQLTASHARFRNSDSYKPVFGEHNVDLLDIIPMYYFMNRTYIPVAMPKILQLKPVTSILQRADTYLRQKRFPLMKGLQLMLAKKGC